MTKYNKGFAHIFLLVVIVLIGIAAVGYFALKGGLIKDDFNNNLATTKTPGQSKAWKIYNNSLGYYSFQYPPDWVIKNVSNSDHPNAVIVRDIVFQQRC